MNKSKEELYRDALSKMAIPTCECLLDDAQLQELGTPANDLPSDTFQSLQPSPSDNRKDHLNDTNRTT